MTPRLPEKGRDVVTLKQKVVVPQGGLDQSVGARAVRLPALSLRLRLLGLRRPLLVLDRLSRRRRRAWRLHLIAVSPAAVCRLVGIAARHGLISATCLRQALVLWFLLHRRGSAA